MFGLESYSGAQHGADALQIDETVACDPAAETGRATGLFAGMKVATSVGWRRVEQVVAGDRVLTFDDGLCTVRAVTHTRHWSGEGPCPAALRPMFVPEGALGNAQPMALLPDQMVVIESDTGDMLFDDPFSLVRMRWLQGLRGIKRVVPNAVYTVVELDFDRDEAVFTANGALVFCPARRGVDLLDAAPEAPRYIPLSRDETAFLVRCLQQDDAIGDGFDPADVVPGYAGAA